MSDRNHSEQVGGVPGWSWIAATVGLVLVVGSAGFMLYRSFAGESSPPEFAIETEAVEPSGNGYLVRIRVTNRGGSVAAGLTVEGLLKEGTTTVETSAISMDYVPSGSQRRAGLIFSRDPRQFDLQIRATGFEQP